MSNEKSGYGIFHGIEIGIERRKMATTANILKEALRLKPYEKAQLIDKLISSLDEPDKEIDELWSKEAENRIDAYDKGKIKAISLENILQKYR